MCNTRSIQDSPIVNTLNSLLRSHEISNNALLVRAVDWYDDSDTVEQKHTKQHQAQDTPLLPSSILHISTRAPNAMFPGGRRASAGVLVGRHLDMNHLLNIHSQTTAIQYSKYNRLLSNGRGNLSTQCSHYHGWKSMQHETRTEWHLS